MPMYSFVCQECGRPFEKKLPMSKAAETQACPSCGSGDTRKSIGAVAVGGFWRSNGALPVQQPGRSPFS
jgi:putative FmdB family regulatory protein